MLPASRVDPLHPSSVALDAAIDVDVALVEVRA
jgi:hypothetical protein